MLVEDETVVLSDKNKKNDMKVEVRVKDPNTIRMCIGDLCAFINKGELENLVFMMADTEVQSKMVPVSSLLVNKLVRKHVCTATRNINKGEKFSVHCEIDVPKMMYSGIEQSVKKKLNKSNKIWAS